MVIVQDEGVVEEITLRSGESKQRRVVKLIDDSNFSIDFTVWGEKSVTIPFNKFQIMALRGVKIGEFNGRTLQTSYSTSFLTKIPQCPELQQLEKFKRMKNNNFSDVTRLSSEGGGKARKLNQIGYILEQAEQNAYTSDPKFFDVKGFVTSIREENLYYQACAD